MSIFLNLKTLPSLYVTKVYDRRRNTDFMRYGNEIVRAMYGVLILLRLFAGATDNKKYARRLSGCTFQTEF